MQKIPYLKAHVSKGQFAKIGKRFAAHELPIFVHQWGQEIEITQKLDEFLEVDSIEAEVARLVDIYGVATLQSVFGASYIDGIELSINRIADKEKKIDDSKNAAKSKNRTSAETRV